VVVRLNHRKILAGLAEAIGAPERLIEFTIVLDKLDKIGVEGVEKELIDRGFDPKVIERLKPMLELTGTPEQKLDKLDTILGGFEAARTGIDELNNIFQTLQKQGLSAVTLDIDLTLARGLNYYTGMIVEVLPPPEVKMGSIGGGGRYDDLTSAFGLKDKSGIGISFGFDRIFLVLEALNLFPKEILKNTEVLFINTDVAALDWSLQALQQLRKQGIAAEMYPVETKFKKQLNYANQKQIPYVIIFGEEEQKQNVFVLKEMTSGTQTRHSLETDIRPLLNR
jgi:histidyl-tRNA synthetase